jgi:hypothetical protein
MTPVPYVRAEYLDLEAFEVSVRQHQGIIQYVPACAHCWHRPRVWQGPLPVPRHCCWCGVHEGPQHGPYAED